MRSLPRETCCNAGSYGHLRAAAQVVSRDIRNVLTQRALYFHIVLDDVSITNLTFSREYTGAVEAKQVAQQESERAKFLVRPLPYLHNSALSCVSRVTGCFLGLMHSRWMHGTAGRQCHLMCSPRVLPSCRS
jgi:hypothetical protein